MRAIVIQQYGGPEQLVLRDLPEPEPVPGQVVIEVKAFGVNHAEIYFRQGAWGDVAPVSGIECAGVVKADGDGKLAKGRKVVAIVGGMGRSFNGSYAQYTRVPASNVAPIDTDLAWEDLAALPESYATAWSCLHDNLAIRPGQTLLVRGATSALGQAAVNIAVESGVRVIATTRNPQRLAALAALGAEHTELEGSGLAARIRKIHPGGIDAVLELVGNSTLVDSLSMVRARGGVCLAGFLGGGDPVPAFNPLLHMPTGVRLSFFGSAFVTGSAEYPLAQIPLQQIVDKAAAGKYKAKPAKVLPFEKIQEAHRLMETGNANGKIVMRL